MIDGMLRDRLENAYMASIPLITLNLLWFVCSLPVVTLIPATAALFYSTNQLAHGKPASWQTFFEGFRLYLRTCWFWGLLNVVVIIALVSNAIFYSRMKESWSVWAQGLVLALSLVWIMIQLFNFPLLLEQEQPRLRQALRNSVVIIIKRPLYALGQGLLVAVIMVASTVLIWPIWAFLTASLCAYLANMATLASIANITGKSAQNTTS